MKKIKFVVLMFVLMCVLVACDVKEDNTSENGGEGCNSVDGAIDEATFDQLVKESENAKLKEKVLEYIKNDEYHHVIDEVDKDGFTYKSVQISFYDNLITPYRELKERLLATDGIKEELEKELDNIIAASPHESSILARKMSARVMVGLYENMGKVMSFERNKDFTPLNEYKVTGLLKCDKSGNIVEAVVFDGAVGSKVEIKDDNLWWEVCIVENVDFYYWGYNYGDKTNYVDGIGKMSGSVYNMMVNDKHDITDIRYVRDTKNNTFESVYVKNYELTLSDFINNEELKKLITTNPADLKNQIRKIYGMEHEQGAYVKKSDFEGWYTQDAMYYFTTDGYLINITTVPRWTKMTMEEAYKIEFEEWEETVSELMFVGELNSELESLKIEAETDSTAGTYEVPYSDTVLSDEEATKLYEYIDSTDYPHYGWTVSYYLEYEGKKYICYQRGNITHKCEEAYRMLGSRVRRDFDKNIYKEEISNKKIMTEMEYSKYRSYLENHSLIPRKEDVGSMVTYRRNEYGYFADSWINSGVFIVDEEKDEMTKIEYNGAVITGLGVNNGEVEFELFISDKVDVYILGHRVREKGRRIVGEGYLSGSVYKIKLNSENEVSKKTLIRDSYDNEFTSLCAKSFCGDWYTKSFRLYVKNQELTLKDFLKDDRFRQEAARWNALDSNTILFGASHTYRNIYDGPQIYFTTDGYVVYIGKYIKYMKMSKDEFIEKYSTMDDESWKGEFKDMMYELRVNDKLVKES